MMMFLDGIDFVRDKTIYALKDKYPDMLSFYRDSNDWDYRGDLCAYVAPEGTSGYFEKRRSINGMATN